MVTLYTNVDKSDDRYVYRSHSYTRLVGCLVAFECIRVSHSEVAVRATHLHEKHIHRRKNIDVYVPIDEKKIYIDVDIDVY